MIDWVESCVADLKARQSAKPATRPSPPFVDSLCSARTANVFVLLLIIAGNCFRILPVDLVPSR